jgi:hypothetical protein
MDDLFRMFDCF